MEQKSRKHGSRASHRAAFLATISQLPKVLYQQNISNLVSQACCGRPRERCVGSGCHASALLTQRSEGCSIQYVIEVKSIPTPVGEINTGAEAKNYIQKKNAEPTGVLQETRQQHLHGKKIFERRKQSIPPDRTSRDSQICDHCIMHV